MKCEGVEWIQLTQDMCQLRSHVNMVINICCINDGKFLGHVSDY
jgi:hypothetical protein